jgi:hypothetical protein
MEISQIAKKVIANMERAIAKSPTGVTMVSIREYQNSNGEISNNIVNIGANLDNAKKKDIEFLRGKSGTTEIEELARLELIKSLESPNANRSKGQIDAYTTITKGVKVHNVTGEIYVFGLRMKKEVLVKGIYPLVNSKGLTIAKNVLRKDLKSSKFTQFKISEISEIRIAGEEISFC